MKGSNETIEGLLERLCIYSPNNEEREGNDNMVSVVKMLEDFASSLAATDHTQKSLHDIDLLSLLRSLQSNVDHLSNQSDIDDSRMLLNKGAEHRSAASKFEGLDGKLPVKLFVGDIPKNVSADHLRVLFNDFLVSLALQRGEDADSCSEVLDAVVIPGRGHSGQSCGFVLMPSLEVANLAIQRLHRKPVKKPVLPKDPPMSPWDSEDLLLAVRIAGKQQNSLAAKILGKGISSYQGSNPRRKAQIEGTSPPLSFNPTYTPTLLDSQVAPAPQQVPSYTSGSAETLRGVLGSAPLKSAEKTTEPSKNPCKLFVGGLPVNITQERLEGLFREKSIGISLVHLMPGRGKSGQACAFVFLSNVKDVSRAITLFHNNRKWWDESSTYTILSCRPAEVKSAVKHAKRGHVPLDTL